MEAFRQGFIDISGSPISNVSPFVQGASEGVKWVDPKQLSVDELGIYIGWINNSKTTSFTVNTDTGARIVTPKFEKLIEFVNNNRVFLLSKGNERGNARYWSLCRYFAMFALEQKKNILEDYSSSNGSGMKTTPYIVGLLVGLGAYFI